MHLYIVIVAFVLAAAAPFMDTYTDGEADYVQQEELEQSDAAESDSEET
jgi:hypothetical protein